MENASRQVRAYGIRGPAGCIGTENEIVSLTASIFSQENETHVHLLKISVNGGQNWKTNERKSAHILNKATTSSVLVKLSISGCTCRSIKSLRSGRIVIGPEIAKVSCLFDDKTQRMYQA